VSPRLADCHWSLRRVEKKEKGKKVKQGRTRDLSSATIRSQATCAGYGREKKTSAVHEHGQDYIVTTGERKKGDAGRGESTAMVTEAHLDAGALKRQPSRQRGKGGVGHRVEKRSIFVAFAKKSDLSW